MNMACKKNIYKKYPLLIVFLIANFGGCFYSFTGASVPSHLQTIAIPIVEDRSGSGEPNLREDFTNLLIQEFISDNTLQVAERLNADAVLENTIVSVIDAPVVVSGGEKISQRRVTITVRSVFKDLVQKRTISDKRYSNYGDYSTDGNVLDNRRSAISVAVDKITEDILLGTVSNW